MNGFSGNPHEIRPLYKDDMEQLSAPLPRSFRSPHMNQTQEWINANVEKWTAGLHSDNSADDKTFIAKVRWFKAIMTVQTQTCLDMLERDVHTLQEEAENMVRLYCTTARLHECGTLVVRGGARTHKQACSRGSS